METDSKKAVDMCIYITDSLWCTYETNTTYINYAPSTKKKVKELKTTTTKNP